MSDPSITAMSAPQRVLSKPQRSGSRTLRQMRPPRPAAESPAHSTFPMCQHALHRAFRGSAIYRQGIGQCRRTHRSRSRPIRRFLRERRGTSAIEFSLRLRLLLLLLFGPIEVSRWVWIQGAIYELAISGARCMTIKAAGGGASGPCDTAKTTNCIRQSAWGISSEITLHAMSGRANATGFSGVVSKHQFISVRTVSIGSNLTAQACRPNQL
jgi:hypothetical protein